MHRANIQGAVNQYDKWLGEREWDYFTTITYKHPVSVKSNYRIMERLEKSLDTSMTKAKMFWIMEYSIDKSTHNHLLLEGDGIKGEVDKYLKKSNLVDSLSILHTIAAKERTIMYANT